MKEEPERATPLRLSARERMGKRANYLTVIVPTIFGWMEQVYL